MLLRLAFQVDGPRVAVSIRGSGLAYTCTVTRRALASVVGTAVLVSDGQISDAEVLVRAKFEP